MQHRWDLMFGAADEARTRYLHLGKVALYQMSYSRIFRFAGCVPAVSFCTGLVGNLKLGEEDFLGCKDCIPANLPLRAESLLLRQKPRRLKQSTGLFLRAAFRFLDRKVRFIQMSVQTLI